MALNASTKLRELLASGYGWRDLLANSKLVVYSGSQPANADASIGSSTALLTFQETGMTATQETRAVWTTTLTEVSATGKNYTGVFLGNVVRTATTQATTTTLITLDASASAVTDFYNGMYLVIGSGTGMGYWAKISAYNGSTKVATLASALPFDPDATVTYYVISGFALTASNVAYTTTLNNTTSLLATAVNADTELPNFTATASTANLSVTAPYNSEAKYNGYHLYVFSDDSTNLPFKTDVIVTTPGVAASGALNWNKPTVSGTTVSMTKESTTWLATGLADLGAAWFRIYVDYPTDTGAADSSAAYRRLDGTVSAEGGGGDLIISNTTIQTGLEYIASSLTLTL